MNIGFFTDTYTPQIDGVVRSILLFKKALEKRGHNVYVFAPDAVKTDEIRFAQNEVGDSEKNVFRFKSIDSLFIPGYPLALPVSIKNSYKISKLDLDIVHTHSPITVGMMGSFVALSENIPCVSTYHTFYSEYAKHYLPLKNLKNATSKMVQQFEVFYCNRVNHLIVPSEKMKRILYENGIDVEISVLPTGVDLEEFKNIDHMAFRRAWQIPRDKKILLCVGRVNTEKNLEFLLRMLKIVKEKNANTVLCIVGDGKGRVALEQKARELNLENDVKFCGFLERKKTIEAFFGADMFVFSSKTDTQGLVLNEAIAAGKPVVMIHDEGLIEAVKNNFNGFEVPANERIFAEKVNGLLQNPKLYDKMTRNSHALAERFSIEKQAEKLEKLYLEAIKYYQQTSLRQKMWRQLNKEYRVRDFIKKLLED